jgi:hypothetical protein
VAGILHDVVCDTSESLKSIEEQFGDDVARLVSGVSKLSYINQVMYTLLIWVETRCKFPSLLSVIVEAC